MLYFFYLLQNDLMEDLFAFFDDDMAFFKVGCGAGLGDIGDLYVVDGNAALLHEPAALPLGGGRVRSLLHAGPAPWIAPSPTSPGGAARWSACPRLTAPPPNSALRGGQGLVRASSVAVDHLGELGTRGSPWRVFSWLPSHLSISSISSMGRKVSMLDALQHRRRPRSAEYW